MTSSTLPSMSFNPMSGPFTLTTDGSKTDGTFTVPGVTTTGIDGQTMTIGGGSLSATMKDGAVSLGDTTVNILGGSWTDKNETLSVQGSVTLKPNFTVTFEGSDEKKEVALSFTDDKASEEAKKMIESGSAKCWKYEKVKKDPNYDAAGIIALGQSIKWSKSLTLSVALDLKVKRDDGDANKENVMVVRTYKVSLGLRPFLDPKPKDPKKPPTIPLPLPLLDPITYKSPEGAPQTIEIEGETVEIQMKEIMSAEEMLETESKDLTVEATEAQASQASAEAELSSATELEASLTAEAEAAEAALAATEAAETEAVAAAVAAGEAEAAAAAEVVTATAEVTSAVAAETAATFSEALDWWSFIGTIISGVTMAELAIAVVIAKNALSAANKKKGEASDAKAKATSTKGQKAAEKAHAQVLVENIQAHKADTKKRIQELQDKIDAAKAKEATLTESFASVKAAQHTLSELKKELSTMSCNKRRRLG